MKLFDVYPLYELEPVRAQGSFIYDKDGKEYLDLYGGHAVISIGHSHPHYVKSISDQLEKIGFYSNSVVISQQQELAQKLANASGYESYQLFLCNSGAEANENALKLASFVNGRKKVIAFGKSFHGRTSLAVAATDDKSIISPVNENENIVFLPLNDEKALEAAIDNTVCAVIVEGIQGVGGVRIPSASFLAKMRALCDKHGVVMILDEIQSGYGRTGKFFAHQHSGVKADIITMAKGMGNGFPVAGLLIHPEIQPKHGMLGTTFGGSYLACAAAIAVLDVIREENLVERAANAGRRLMEGLKGMDGVKEIRGIGLMIGVELEIPCAAIRNKLIQKHLILTGTSSDKNTLRILPALNISDNEIDSFLRTFKVVLEEQFKVSASI